MRGYAIRYNEWSVPMMGFKERVAASGPQRALKEKQDVRALWNHDSNFVLGRSANDTLALASDDDGLRVEIDPPDTQWARDARESVRRGDVNQMSFAFRVVSKDGEKWWEDKDGLAFRELLDFDLLDVSPVTFPAYPQTSITTRDQHALVALRKLEHGLELTDEERSAIEVPRVVIQGFTPSEPPEPEPPAFDERAAREQVALTERRYASIRRTHGISR